MSQAFRTEFSTNLLPTIDRPQIRDMQFLITVRHPDALDAIKRLSQNRITDETIRLLLQLSV